MTDHLTAYFQPGGMFGYLQNLGFFVILIVVSVALTWLCRRYIRIMDVASKRSSHVGAISRSGGIAIVITFCVGIITYYFVHNDYFVDNRAFSGLFIASLLIALVSFYDDVTDRALAFKVCSQLIGVAVLIAYGLTINEITVPYYGKIILGIWKYPVTVLWIMGITNAFNFMDGLNGLAAGVAVIASLAFMFISFSMGSKFVFHVSYILSASCIGFLIFNYPKASIFMGDIGSTFLGFCFGALAILAANYDSSHTPFLVIPILLANIVLECFMTFIRRFMAGDKVHKAHRTHPYQLLNQLGMPAALVTLMYYFQSLLLIIVCVIYLMYISEILAVLVMASLFVIYSMYFATIHILARKNGFV